MSFIECSFFSKSLRTQAAVTVLIPSENMFEGNTQKESYYKSGKKHPTLFLFHGIWGGHMDWVRNSNIIRYAQERQVAVVLPSAVNSFYTDMAYGAKYFTFISEELPQVMRTLFPLSDKREDTFVAGLSMGGYGALKLALRKPDSFAAVASLSGAVDIVSQINSPDILDLKLKDVFGDLSKVKGSDNDLFYLTEKLKANGTSLPKIYQACGTEDFLYKDNLSFKEHMEKLNIDFTYEEAKGGHDWNFWDTYIQKVLKWMPI